MSEEKDTEPTGPQTAIGFGGVWTQQKLDILEKYLDAYTTALKKQPFKLLYIDAFAGTGRIESLPSKRSAGDFYDLIGGAFGDDDGTDLRDFTSGSAERAVKVSEKPFDRWVFVEKNTDRCAELETMKEKYSGRDIRIINSDANDFISNMEENWSRWRGVLFLDPFATEVKWSTLETVAGIQALDTWILFPTHAVMRMLSRSRMPDGKVADRLTEVYGDESWKGLYREQPSLFGDGVQERQAGAKRLVDIYKENLRQLFGERFLPRSRSLKNSRNGPLFEFIFCAGHPKGARIAKDIAEHIVGKI